MTQEIVRREFLKRTSGLILGFALGGFRSSEGAPLTLGPYGPPDDSIDSWLVIGDDGNATLYSGCCELGTGSSTGLLQVMAEELDLPFERTRLVHPDTSLTPDQYVSSGSRTIWIHSRPIRQAAAEARQALLKLAAERLGAPVDRLVTENGAVQAAGAPNRRLTYGELIGGRRFDLKVTGKVKPKQPGDYKVVGTSVPRIDIPGKVFGTFTFLQDVKVPGMVHGRIVRPPSQGGKVLAIDEKSVAHLPGVLKVVRRADLVGVVCQREEQAIRAAAALRVKWSDWAGLPGMEEIYARFRSLPEYPPGYPKKNPAGLLDRGGDVDGALAQATTVVKASYESPYHHHGSIGPSCAVADAGPGGATICALRKRHTASGRLPRNSWAWRTTRSTSSTSRHRAAMGKMAPMTWLSMRWSCLKRPANLSGSSGRAPMRTDGRR